MAYHALTRKADSDAALIALNDKYGKDAPYNIAYIYAFRGEADKALEWLDKTIAYQDPGISDDRRRESVRQRPFRSALAAVPAQYRHGAGATREDRVQGELPKEWQAEAHAGVAKPAQSAHGDQRPHSLHESALVAAGSKMDVRRVAVKCAEISVG